MIIGGYNFNTPVSVNDNREVVLFVLKGSRQFGGPATPLAFLNQQYVAAQISMSLLGWKYDALWSSIGCYGKLIPKTQLSNGKVLSGDSMLKEVFEQALAAIKENRTADMTKIANIFAILNGNSLSSLCND